MEPCPGTGSGAALTGGLLGTPELQKQEEANQRGMPRPTPLHCPGSPVTPSPGRLPSSRNNGSPADNVSSCLEAAPGALPPWHHRGCCGSQANRRLHRDL